MSAQINPIVSPEPRTAAGRAPGGEDAAASRDRSLDYLRAFATVMVLVMHCSGPYAYQVQPLRPVNWLSPIPVIDGRSSLVMDYVLTLLDASVMSLMFFISGLFMDRGLRRKGVGRFLRERLLRLGLPFVAMVLVLMPLAYYAGWSLLYPGRSFFAFLRSDAHPGALTGPAWFLWLLFFFDCVMAALYLPAGRLVPRLAAPLRALAAAPWRAALLFTVAALVLYVPLELHYRAFWMHIKLPFLVLQPSRVLLYAAWLVFGYLVGSVGLNEGLLAPTGSLARHWRLWVVAGAIAAQGCWFVTRPEAMLERAPRGAELAGSTLWVVANVGICFALLALFRGRVRAGRAWADSFARCAYAIYAIHYVFALWSERILVPAGMPALAKFAIAMVVTTGLSWGAAAGWLAIWSRITAMTARRTPGRAAA